MIMGKKFFKLLFSASMVFVLFVGVDISKESGETFVSARLIVGKSVAFGCGANYLNHQAWKQGGTICFGNSGSPTDFVVYPYNDCRDEWNSCCQLPDVPPTCLSESD